MDLKAVKKLYFLGIGGIGMSALARFFLNAGVEIHGYDLSSSRLTKKLEAEGMHIHYNIDINKIPHDIDGVIITPAIPKDHAELVWLKENKYAIKKRAEVLGLLSRDKKCVAIAGTHGKTTTSSILSHILTYCEMDISAFIGGILVNENSNFIQGNSDIIVLEADEFDRSFLNLFPSILVILSIDADHLDIYGDVRSLHQAYEDLTYQVRPGGEVLLLGDYDKSFAPDWHEKMKNLGIHVKKINRDFSFENVRIENEKFVFDFKNNDLIIEEIKSSLPGEYNISNASVSIEIALKLGAKVQQVKSSMTSFKGIKRRFEILHDEERVLIDDYAHHPEELKNALKTVKKLYPNRQVLGIFQPHLYSRTNDFFREFAEQLNLLDEVWLLEIYPARELPMKGVASEMIFNLIPKNKKRLIFSGNLLSELAEKKDLEVVMTIGASDIDKYHNDIIEILKK